MMSMLAALSVSSVRYQSATKLISWKFSPDASAIRWQPMLHPIASKAAKALRRRPAAINRVATVRKKVAKKVRPIVDVDQNIDQVDFGELAHQSALQDSHCICLVRSLQRGQMKFALFTVDR